MRAKLNSEQTDAIVAMAWADRVTFEEIFRKTGMYESDVIKLMRKHLKRSSFIRWRKRVSGRITKHRKILKHRTQSLTVVDDDLPEPLLVRRQRSEQ